MTNEQIAEELKKYKWYHTIQINPKISTPGTSTQQQNHIYQILSNLNIKNKKVIDIGCRDAKFCFESEKLGASRVVGIDNCISLGAKELLIPLFQSEVELYEHGIYDLTKEKYGYFDIVLFLGILYHLKYPFLALQKLMEITQPNAILIIETAVWNNTTNKSLLYCPTSQETAYDHSSLTFFNYKGLENNLEIFGFKDFIWHSPKTINNDQISRATLTCTRHTLAADKIKLHEYWKGNSHKTWQK